MLGEQFAELKVRVLDSEGPTLETSVSARGSVKGTQVNETLTYVARLISSRVLHREGHGVIMAGESDLVSYIGEGVGRLTCSGTIWHGAILYRTCQPVSYHFLTMLSASLKPKWMRREIFQRTSGNGSK